MLRKLCQVQPSQSLNCNILGHILTEEAENLRVLSIPNMWWLTGQQDNQIYINHWIKLDTGN